MSPVLCSCNLCGWAVADSDGVVSWLNQFRGLVAHPTGDIALTGVGLYDDVERGSFIAPFASAARWDDPGYERPESDEFGVNRRFENGRYGFIFHASCWSILERTAYPERIPLESVYEICLSLPRPRETSCVSWNHDYGGLVAIDDQHYFPWEERESMFVFDSSGISDSEEGEDTDSSFGAGNSLGIPAANRLPLPDDDDEEAENDNPKPKIIPSIPKTDPFNISEIQFLLSEKPMPPPIIQPLRIALPTRDSLFKLPEEIRTRIALFLSTSDALNCRRASRSFWFVFDSYQFWLSRFRANAERSWLFEAKQIDGFRDWRWLYHRTNSVKFTSSPAIENRRRVWDLAQKVTDIWWQLKGNKALADTCLTSNMESNFWFKASGDIKIVQPESPHINFYEGCRVLHTQQQSLEPGFRLSRITFSFVSVGNAQFLTGIRLITLAGDEVQLGYKAGCEQTVNISSLSGFILALGSRGIRAVRCITDYDNLPWCGNPDNLPKSRRLAIRGPISAIKTEIDGCKIVSLSVASSTSHPQTLQDAGVWFPDIPGPQLCLNDDFYAQREHHVCGFRPIIWTLFGGPGGIYLQNLTGIAVHTGGSIPSIEFRHNSSEIPDEYSALGKHKCGKYAPGCKTPSEFSLDGPGGERISSVEVYLTFIDEKNVCEIFNQGALQSFKIFTNFGRSFHFRDESMDGYKDFRMEVKKFTPADGTIIMGFYARPFNSEVDYGLASLGVITEVMTDQ